MSTTAVNKKSLQLSFLRKKIIAEILSFTSFNSKLEEKEYRKTLLARSDTMLLETYKATVIVVSALL